MSFYLCFRVPSLNDKVPANSTSACLKLLIIVWGFHWGYWFTAWEINFIREKIGHWVVGVHSGVCCVIQPIFFISFFVEPFLRVFVWDLTWCKIVTKVKTINFICFIVIYNSIVLLIKSLFLTYDILKKCLKRVWNLW